MNIVVQYPTGRKDYVSVADGCTVVGSDKDCDIVIADGSIEKLHLKLFSDGKALEVENISSCAAWLNEDPLMERAPLVFGDILRIGGITIILQEPFVFGADKTKSPDGVRKMRKSIGRDVRAGWLGYRRVMEKLSSFISVDEAKIAADCYKSGLRAFFFVFAVVFVGNLAASLLQFEQWYKTSAVLLLCVQFFANAAILLLVGRFRMAFAGRVLWPVIAFSQLCPYLSPMSACNDYWDDAVWQVGGILALAILIGWIVDYGAGFVFEEKKKRRVMRFSALMLLSVTLIGLSYLSERSDPQPVAWYWSILAELPCLIWLFVYKKILASNAHVPFDSLFVAEIASKRAWKRMLYRILAFALLVTPVISILSLIGEEERRQWPADDSDALWTDERTKNEAWFWADRGRYLKKSDLNSSQIFNLPLSLLANPASSNEWAESFGNYRRDGVGDNSSTLTNLFYRLTEKINEEKEYVARHSDSPTALSCCDFVLSDFATNVCALVCAVSTGAEDVVACATLCEALAEYRVSSTNYAAFAQNLGTNAVCVICESIKRHPQYGKNVSYVCSAGFKIGVTSADRDCVRDRQYCDDCRAKHDDWIRREFGLILVFVLAALATLIIYRRGSDSSVGLWLGLGLFGNVVSLTSLLAGFSDGIPVYIKYAVWREAFDNPLFSLLACCLSMCVSMSAVFVFLGTLAQTILFVVLCWPTVHEVSMRKRRWLFWAKAFLVLFVASVISFLVGVVLNTSSLLIVRMPVVAALGLWGWWLRRSRRQYTEIPRLGFGFFLGWFVAEVAIAVCTSWVSQP